MRIMSGKAARWWTVSAAALLCLAPALDAALAQNGAPDAPGSAPPPQFPVDSATLQRYAGYYRLGDTDIQGVMTIALTGSQLTMQFTGGQPIDLYPQSATHFVLDPKVVAASVDFVARGKAPATAVTLHTATPDLTLHRMDAAAAGQFNARLAARIQSNMPLPGSQAAVSDWLTRLASGQPPDYSTMSPAMAVAAQAQADRTASAIRSLGALQSVKFQKVTPIGADLYLAKFDKGAVLVVIALDSKGRITSMVIQGAQ
jgi:hypothetical protein